MCCGPEDCGGPNLLGSTCREDESANDREGLLSELYFSNEKGDLQNFETWRLSFWISCCGIMEEK